MGTLVLDIETASPFEEPPENSNDTKYYEWFAIGLAYVSDFGDTPETEVDESFRSKVQYNARTLAEKGYIVRESHGRSYRVELSLLGAVWMQRHNSPVD